MTDGRLLYWVQGDLLHRLDMQSGATATFPGPSRDYPLNCYDVDGDWLVWLEEDAFDDPNMGIMGRIYARNLKNGETLLLGSSLDQYGILDDYGIASPHIDGQWVVWATELDKNGILG